MIAYAFPPEGAAGVFRPLRFIRYLPNSGWRGHVIACEGYHYERYDPALLNLVPEETEAVRIPVGDSWQAFQAWRARRQTNGNCAGEHLDAERPNLGKSRTSRRFMSEIVQAAEARIYHPDRAMFWIRPAAKATVEMCSRKNAAVIWATAGPVSSFIVAYRASRRTGLPYVLDFRDSWTVTYSDFEARRPQWAIDHDRRQMYRVLKQAQAVTFRYQSEAECYWRLYPGALDRSRIHIIPNGFESMIEHADSPLGSKCKILYAGTVSSYRYDTLLQALHALKESSPSTVARLQLQFVGEGAQALAEAASSLSLSNMIIASRPIPNEDVNRLCREAHALLVLGRPTTMKGHELMAGAKLFSYLKERKPIIGILPDGESKNVLESVRASTTANVDSRPEIVSVLKRVVDAWARGTLSELVPDKEKCEEYSASRQTAALVRALEGVPAEDRFVPGAVAVPSSLQAEIMARSAVPCIV